MLTQSLSSILPLFCILFLQECRCQYSQTLAVPYQTEDNCTTEQYFNPRHLSCVPCVNGTVPSASKLTCECPQGSIISTITATGMLCKPCPQGSYPSPSRLVCISCPNPPCCPASFVLPIRNADGSVFGSTTDLDSNATGTHDCIKCVDGTFPNADGTSCEPCSTLECFCKVNPSNCSPAFTIPFVDPTVRHVTGAAVRSALLVRRLNATAWRCTAGSEVDCQALTNLCVLQNIDTSPGTACDIIEKLRTNRPEGPAPPLFFSGDSDAELNRENAITQRFMFSEGQNGRIQLLLTRYALNGTFLGYVRAEKVLQPCAPSEVQQAFEFGRRYKLSCKEAISQMVGKRPPEFYEAFLKFFNDEGEPQLYPVAILNNLIRSTTGSYLNQMSRVSNAWVLTRRFFLVEDVSLSMSNQTRIRYASDVELRVELQTTRDGLIFPPFLTVAYSESDCNHSAVVQRKLSVTYDIDPARHDRELEITMAVLGPLSVLWATVKAYSWGRRSGKASLLDATTVLQFILYECAALGDVFFVVLTAMSCWITFAYKTQSAPFYSILDQDQEWTLMAYLIVTLCLKFISLMHAILGMILQETFFIDWERPQCIEDTHLPRPISRDVSKDRKEIPVVVWRTYFVANEWAELRCVRATSVGLQLLVVLMLLQAFNFMRFAIVEPGFAEGSISSETTVMTRLAVVIFFYLVVGFSMWAIEVAIVERMITDPFHNFIDLCSIANISVLALCHPLHGYYIHGRSAHGRADTGMAEMNEFLQKERDDMCGFRGLEPTSHLQTFTVNLPMSFRSRYDEIMNSMRNSPQGRLSGIDQTTAKMTATVRAHEQMNTLIREFIDHSTADMDYMIRDRSFAEALLDTELTDTTQTGNFLRDPSEVAFSNCFIYGREWAHFSFEATLFVVLFLLLNSLSLAAAIVFCISHGITAITALLCKNHLVKSSLVDHRFLI
ncbi:hypothetical protein Q1695_003711 [Nippostrongylus brasiliensis]|nr:hypothetical protein Q1695_003711 [Nippostrongylus brasiliensis]